MTIEHPNSMTIELPHRYEPRDYQVGIWRAMDEVKRVFVCAHRRWGKDKLFFNKLVCKAMERPANLAYYFPTAVLGRKALWKNVDVTNGMRVIDHIPKDLLSKAPNETNMMLDFVNGSTLQILGSDNLDVVGGNYFGVAFSEYQKQNPLAWDLTRPILAENKGFAWFNGTAAGENHFYDLMCMNIDNPLWHVEVQNVDDTGAISAEDIEAERRSGMSDNLIRQEFYCDFSATNEGAIWGRFITQAETEGRIAGFPIDGRAPVCTSWDLGGPRNTTVWYFQRLPGGVTRFIDCDIGLNLTLVERVAWMKSKGYQFDKHFVPHDAGQTSRTGRTWAQDAKEAGLANVVVVPPIPEIWMGVDYVSQLFPSFEFRKPATDAGVKGLKAYESAPDTSGGITRNMPLHNWASHIADGLRTMAEADRAGPIAQWGKSVQVTFRKPAMQATMGLRGRAGI